MYTNKGTQTSFGASEPFVVKRNVCTAITATTLQCYTYWVTHISDMCKFSSSSHFTSHPTEAFTNQFLLMIIPILCASYHEWMLYIQTGVGHTNV